MWALMRLLRVEKYGVGDETAFFTILAGDTFYGEVPFEGYGFCLVGIRLSVAARLVGGWAV